MSLPSKSLNEWICFLLLSVFVTGCVTLDTVDSECPLVVNWWKEGSGRIAVGVANSGHADVIFFLGAGGQPQYWRLVQQGDANASEYLVESSFDNYKYLGQLVVLKGDSHRESSNQFSPFSTHFFKMDSGNMTNGNILELFLPFCFVSELSGPIEEWKDIYSKLKWQMLRVELSSENERTIHKSKMFPEPHPQAREARFRGR